MWSTDRRDNDGQCGIMRDNEGYRTDMGHGINTRNSLSTLKRGQRQCLPLNELSFEVGHWTR